MALWLLAALASAGEATCEHGFVGRTVIAYTSAADVEAAERKRAMAEGRPLKPERLAPQGLITGEVHRQPMDAAERSRFRVVFVVGGVVMGEVPQQPAEPRRPRLDPKRGPHDAPWWTALRAPIPAGLAPPLEVRVHSVAGEPVCAAKLLPNGKMKAVKFKEN